MKIILAVLSPLLVLFIGNSHTTKEQVEGLFDKAYKTLDTHPDSSYIYAETALSIAESKKLDWHQANAKFIQGYIHEQKGQFSKAILLNLEAINILKELDDSRSKKDHVKLLINTGNILRKHLKYDDALKLYDDALRIAEESDFDGKETRIIKVHYNKSITYREMGDLQNAIEEAKKCNDLSVVHGNEPMMISSWNQLGIIHRKNEFYAEAKEYYQAIIDFDFQKIDGQLFKARSYHNLANVLWDMGQLKEAETAYQRALTIHLEKNSQRDLFFTYRDISDLYFDLGNTSSAIAAGNEALALYDKVPLELTNYQLFKNLSELYIHLGQFEQAGKFLNRYHAENETFIANRDFIAQQSNKFKIEVVLAGYYDQVASREQVASLTNWLIVVLVVSLVIIGVGYWRWKWIKHQLEAELRAHFKELSEIFSPHIQE
ncbi:MAG: tetratricopeptide repeat protein [Cyclobacteriaceae bacterium]